MLKTKHGIIALNKTVDSCGRKAHLGVQSTCFGGVVGLGCAGWGWEPRAQGHGQVTQVCTGGAGMEQKSRREESLLAGINLKLGYFLLLVGDGL